MTLRAANGGVQIGGAIQNSGNLTVANSVFDSNESRGGGAIGSTLSLTVNNCTFTNNRSTGSGGGLNGGGAVFSNSTVSISRFDIYRQLRKRRRRRRCCFDTNQYQHAGDDHQFSDKRKFRNGKRRRYLCFVRNHFADNYHELDHFKQHRQFGQ